MTDRGRTEDFELQVGISDDIIAEALKSVEKHIKPNAESTRTPKSSGEALEEAGGDEKTDEITDVENDSGFEELASVLDVEVPTGGTAPPPLSSEDAQLIERLKQRVAQLTRDNDALRTALHEKNSEAEKNFDRVLWLSAELDNLRKRMAREKADMEKFGNERLLRELLQVVDNLERTLKHTGSSRDIAVLEEGVEMTLTQFQGCLRRFGVLPIELSPGTPFDPAVHEAMMQEETDEYPPNTIVREFQRGYMYHDRLLRASLVTVARASAGWSGEEAGDEITTELSDDYVPPGAEGAEGEEPVPDDPGAGDVSASGPASPDHETADAEGATRNADEAAPTVGLDAASLRENDHGAFGESPSNGSSPEQERNAEGGVGEDETDAESEGAPEGEARAVGAENDPPESSVKEGDAEAVTDARASDVKGAAPSEGGGPEARGVDAGEADEEDGGGGRAPTAVHDETENRDKEKEDVSAEGD